MSAERGGKNNFRPRDAVGVTAEVGGLGLMVYGVAEIIAASVLWPVAIGGALFLLGRGIVKSGRGRKAEKSTAHH